MIRVAMLGASGRMGQSIVGCISESEDFALAGAVTRPDDPLLGDDAGTVAGVPALGIALTDHLRQGLDQAQVAIDFTLPEALESNLAACVSAGTPIVIGTTGLTERHHSLLDQAAQEIPLVYARNMSIGVNVFIALVAEAARVLGPEYDCEIIEAHHRHKVDAPSGTALAVGEAVAQARGRRLEDLAVRGRDGHTGPRVPDTIGFSVIRGGDIVGDHTAMFVAPEERLEFVHRAGDRRTFARGALRAARWVVGRAPGLYGMGDVLGLDAMH
jgi:4-hydroxy-tetrahydrodipicolinate reductase